MMKPSGDGHFIIKLWRLGLDSDIVGILRDVRCDDIKFTMGSVVCGTTDLVTPIAGFRSPINRFKDKRVAYLGLLAKEELQVLGGLEKHWQSKSLAIRGSMRQLTSVMF
jgi:hypothetical protein